MKRKLNTFICVVALVFGLTGCQNSNNQDQSTSIKGSTENNGGSANMSTSNKISVSDGQYVVIFELNDSSASISLYNQLPLDIRVENYGGNEKIFYPEPLDISDTPLLQRGPVGTLAYFAPWDDVVMYYSQCGPYSGLYHLGFSINGTENISKLSGMIHIEKVIEG